MTGTLNHLEPLLPVSDSKSGGNPIYIYNYFVSGPDRSGLTRPQICIAVGCLRSLSRLYGALGALRCALARALTAAVRAGVAV